MDPKNEGRLVKVELTLEQHGKQYEVINTKINETNARIPDKWKVDLSWALWIGLIVGASGLLGAFIYKALDL